MVAYLTNRDGGITVFAKVSGEGGGFNFIGAGEEGSVTRRAISSGEKGVARGTARGGLDIVPGEGAAAGGEGIDMRRVNVVGSEATEFGAEVIDADKKNVLLGEAGAEKCEKDEEDSHKARPYESNRGTSAGNLNFEKLFSKEVRGREAGFHPARNYKKIVRNKKISSFDRELCYFVHVDRFQGHLEEDAGFQLFDFHLVEQGAGLLVVFFGLGDSRHPE